MNILSIVAENGEVQEQEIHMQANSVYSFFNSILIDELFAINEHVIYTDANALSEGKKAYFIGEQLVIGDALIHARTGMEDRDVAITKTELEALITRDVNQFYQDALAVLSQTDINLYKVFNVQRGAEDIELSVQWVLYTFNIADMATQEYFIKELQKTLDNNDSVEKYVQKMAKLALNSVQ